MLMHRSLRRRTSVQVFRRAHPRSCSTLTPLIPFLSAERKTSLPFPYHFALGLESRASENLIYLLTLAVASSFSFGYRWSDLLNTFTLYFVKCSLPLLCWTSQKSHRLFPCRLPTTSRFPFFKPMILPVTAVWVL